MKFKVEYPLQTLSFLGEDNERSVQLGSNSNLETDDFQKLAGLAAQSIYEDAGGDDLYVCMSGGLDSEFVADIFLKQSIPFKAAIMSMENGLNEFDIKWAREFCEKHKIPILEVSIDAENFFSSKQNLEYARRFGCASPQLALHMWLQSQIPGYFVFAGELPIFRKTKDDLRMINVVHPDIYAMELQKKQLSLKGCTSFFLSSKELFGAYEAMPYIEQFDLVHAVDGAIEFTHDFYWSEHLKWVYKKTLMQKLGFEPGNQPTKYSGFEGFHALESGLRFDGADSWSDWPLLFKGLESFNQKHRRPQEQVAKYNMTDVFDVIIEREV